MIVESNGMVSINQILFKLIRSEIYGIDIDESTKEELSYDALCQLYRVAKAHDVAQIVSSALYKYGILKEDDETSRKFKKTQMMSIYRCESMKYAFGQICSVFEKQEIPYVPLKGSIIRSFYPYEWMRTSCDIDILVHEDDLNRAVKAIVELLGYKADSRADYHDISLYSQNGIHLELHFSIKEHMDNIDGLLSEAWIYAYREKKDGFRYNQTPEYFVFHHIAHMSYHFAYGGCGIKPFIDLCIIRNKMDYDEKVVRSYCRQCGIESFYNNVLYVTDVWFGDEPHTPLSRQIEEYILNGGVYGSLENIIAVAQSKRGGKIKYGLSRIFVSYDSLKNFYPILNEHKWLFLIMQVRRWFRLIFCGGIKRGVHEMKASQNVSQSQVSKMKNFLRDIGL